MSPFYKVRIVRGDLGWIDADAFIVSSSGGFSGGAAKAMKEGLEARRGLKISDAFGGSGTVPEGQARARRVACRDQPDKSYQVVCCNLKKTGSGSKPKDTRKGIKKVFKAALDALEVKGKSPLKVATHLIGSGLRNADRQHSAAAMIHALKSWKPPAPGVDLTIVAWTPSAYRSLLKATEKLPQAASDAKPHSDTDSELLATLGAKETFLFVGSGLSFNADPKMPRWVDLFQQDWLTKHKYKGTQADGKVITPDLNLVDLAQLVYDEWRAATSLDRAGMPPAHSDERMPHKCFLERVKTHAAPSLTHYQLLSLPWSAIITTNYDTLIERTLKGLRIPHTVVRNDKDLGKLAHTDKLPVVKIHGGLILNEGDNDQKIQGDDLDIVATRDEYDGFFEQRPALASYLEARLASQRGLIIGYSLSDPHLRELFTRIGRRRAHHKSSNRLFAVTVNSQGTPSRLAPYWKRRDIAQVALKTDQFRDTVDQWCTRSERDADDRLVCIGAKFPAKLLKVQKDDARRYRNLLRHLLEAGYVPSSKQQKHIIKALSTFNKDPLSPSDEAFFQVHFNKEFLVNNGVV